MPIGDRIGSARTCGFMRRINALENLPAITTDDLDTYGKVAFQSDDVFYAGDIGTPYPGYKISMQGQALKRLTAYPGLLATFPHVLTEFNGFLYHRKKVEEGTTDATTAGKLVDSTQNFSSTVEAGYYVRNSTDGTFTTVTSVDSNTQLTLASDIFTSGEGYEVTGVFKYTESTNTWAHMTGVSTEFLKWHINFITGIGGEKVTEYDGKLWHRKSPVSGATFLTDTLYSFDEDGVLQSTVTLGDDGSGDIVGAECAAFCHDSSGNIYTIHKSTAVSARIIAKYTSTGTVVTGSFGGADYITTGLGTTTNPLYQIMIHATSGKIIALGHDDVGSYTTAGATTAEISPVGAQLGVYESVYISKIESSANLSIRIYDEDLTFIRSFNIFHFDSSAASQTTWYQYPTPGNDTGKITLGTVDGGVTIPVDVALQGLRPHYFELRDMRDAIETISVNFTITAPTEYGTATATTTNKLVDSGQNFTSTVTVGDRVLNTTDGTFTTVSAVDSDTTLSLNANIFAINEGYTITPYYTLTAGANNIFRLAIDSGQDDWTTPTITHKARPLESDYNDIDLVITELEASALV